MNGYQRFVDGALAALHILLVRVALCIREVLPWA